VAAKPFRRKTVRWCTEEVDALLDGVRREGVGKWAAILKGTDAFVDTRTSIDLKDKWRNISAAVRAEVVGGSVDGARSSPARQSAAAGVVDSGAENDAGERAAARLGGGEAEEGDADMSVDGAESDGLEAMRAVLETEDWCEEDEGGVEEGEEREERVEAEGAGGRGGRAAAGGDGHPSHTDLSYDGAWGHVGGNASGVGGGRTRAGARKRQRHRGDLKSKPEPPTDDMTGGGDGGGDGAGSGGDGRFVSGDLGEEQEDDERHRPCRGVERMADGCDSPCRGLKAQTLRPMFAESGSLVPQFTGEMRLATGGAGEPPVESAMGAVQDSLDMVRASAVPPGGPDDLGYLDASTFHGAPTHARRLDGGDASGLADGGLAELV
jgi:Myb-like DNA-binding domain